MNIHKALPLAAVLLACLAPSRAVAPEPAAASAPTPFLVKDAAPLLAGLPAPGERPPAAGDRAPDPSAFWNKLTGELGSASTFPPPRLSRAYSLVHVAIHDALWAARGDPAADHPRAIAAAAASTVLVALFDRERDRVIGEAQAQLAGDPAPERAVELGRRVGAQVVEHGRADGYGPGDDTPVPPATAQGQWDGINAITPGAAFWKTWWLESPEDLGAQPPHAFGSREDLADLEEVEAVAARRTPEQIRLVRKWAETSPPTLWNEMLFARISRTRPPPLEVARAYVYLNTAMHDAFVSCWRTKYKYMVARPFQRQPSLRTVIKTPNFPTYTSGHATISGAASEVLAALYPAEAELFRQQAQEAADSRLWGGIHFRHDNEEGLVVGRRIGGRVVDVMRRRGAL